MPPTWNCSSAMTRSIRSLQSWKKPRARQKEFEVTYDETYGFPTQITIDHAEMAADDELYLSISNFEVLP